MKQDNNNVRQITPEEIAQAQGLTPEELQQTQVLNLNDLQKTIRFEKISSKKPALIVAAIGLVLLFFGTAYQLTGALKTTKPEKNIVEKKEVVKDTKVLNSVKTTLNNPDGTDTVYTIDYKFEDNKLIEVTKSYNVIPTPGNSGGINTIESLKNMYKTPKSLSEGYTITLTESGDSITIVTSIDYKKLDLTKINSNESKAVYTGIDYQRNTDYKRIREDMLDQGFTVE